MIRIVKIVLLLWSCLVISLNVNALNKIVVFGDSLSDNGNFYEYVKHEIPLSPPYYAGRFCNGPVWVEQLTQYFYGEHAKDHLLDYAFGLAGVLDDEDSIFTLKREVDSYLLAHQDKVDLDSLYIVWIGSNNYLSLPEDEDNEVTSVIDGIKQNLKRLADRGAQYFLLVNLPDLGLTPGAHEVDAVPLLTSLSIKHNDALTHLLTEMRQAYPTAKWLLLDSFQFMHDMATAPATYHLHNVTDTCYDTIIDQASKSTLSVSASNEPINDQCYGYLFFDSVHPTYQAHRMMAERAKNLLEQAGLQFFNSENNA